MKQNEADVSVTLIDANDWIGGRARTSTNPPGLPVDLGPQFIQDPGLEYNPWAKIAQDMGRQVVQVGMEALYRTSHVQNWSTVDTNPGISAMNSQMNQGYQVATGFNNAAILTQEAGNLATGQQDMKLSLGSNGLGAIAESAEPWQYVAKDQARQEEVDFGANWYVEGGLGQLVSDYGAQLLATYGQLKSFGNTTVNRIQDAGSKKVSIHTSDGSVQQYDFCIVTIPCSEVAKIAFEPKLPGARVRADSFIALGSYKKVAFRPSQLPEGYANTIDEGCEYYIYDREGDGVWQYFRLPTDPTILICVTAGDFARRLDDQPPDAVARSVVALLNKAYVAGSGDFTPVNNETVVTNWTQMPHIHGAYSYTRFESELGPDNPVPLAAREEIAKPHGRIHFAGEATWVEAYGTIHGAFKSGARAAREILEAIQV
jgi:monoamine oxidase